LTRRTYNYKLINKAVSKLKFWGDKLRLSSSIEKLWFCRPQAGKPQEFVKNQMDFETSSY
jgi:hypothetical protein